MKGRGPIPLFTLTPALSPAYRQAGVKGEGDDIALSINFTQYDIDAPDC